MVLATTLSKPKDITFAAYRSPIFSRSISYDPFYVKRQIYKPFLAAVVLYKIVAAAAGIAGNLGMAMSHSAVYNLV